MKYKRLLSAISFMMALSAPLSAQYVTIGTGTSSSYYHPYGTNSCYSTTQSIYTAAEMGGAKKIETIAYQVASAGALSTTQIKIYMGHTTKSYFSSSSNYENVSGMTLVYSGSPTLAASTGWEEFTLSTPFGYNGTTNLVVVVAKQASSWSSGKYYYTSTSNAQCLYRASDNNSSYGDATNYSDFSTKTQRANVRFGYEPDLRQDGISYIFTTDTEASVARCTATTGAVTIPATVTKDGKTYSVTSIGNDAFTGCTGIKEVKIEDGTTTLKLGYKSNTSSSSYYYGLFKDCPIEKLYLGRNLSYSTRYYYSSYPSYGAPFEYQSQMKSVEIGKDVTSIGDYAFYGCSGLTSLTIPSSVTSIGNYAFYNCSGLTSISIPSSVASIGYSAFYE